MSTSRASVSRHVASSAVCLFLSCIPNCAAVGGFLDNVQHEAGSCLSGGCDVIWHVNRRIDDGISSKFSNAAEPVKKAFEEAATDLFKNDLNPFIDRVNALVNTDMDRIDVIFQNALVAAEAATDRTIDSISQKIVVESGKQIRDVSDHILTNVECAENLTAEKIQEVLDRNFRLFGSIRDEFLGLFDSCPVPNRTNSWSIYSGLKCEYEKQIGVAKTVADVENNYREMLVKASEYQCIFRSVPANEAVARADEINYTKRLNLWLLAQQ
jgi:hypothetical protein